MGNITVLSMSAISTFLRCKKKYQIQYEMLLDGTKENDALVEGAAFHSLMAERAKTGSLPDIDSPMRDAAREYLTHNEFPSDIILIEEPIYIEFRPEVFVRCTFDLVYRSNNTIVIRDWKTFARLPSLDADLDFQARLYIACAMKYFKTTDVRFEHIYVRRTAPFIPHTKKGDVWQPEDCYLSESIVLGLKEAAIIVEETLWAIDELLKTRISGRYTRTNLKGGGYDSCSSCSVKEICKANLVHDELTEEVLYGIAKKREPIEVPVSLVGG